ISGQLAQHFPPLGHAEHGALLRVSEDGDHELFKNLAASLNQVEVPVRGRIKGTRIDGRAFIQSSSVEDRPPSSASSSAVTYRFYAGGAGMAMECRDA